MGARYEEDVVLWSQEQARALRERDFSKLDIEHLAEEIEDVGKSEKRELANRMAVVKSVLHDADWRRDAWLDAIRRAANETGLDEIAFRTPPKVP